MRIVKTISSVSPFTGIRQFRSYTNSAFRIVEVGARDGLQNEKTFVPTDIKVELINRLSRSGLKTVEATSFVAPKWVPQMADHSDVIAQIEKVGGVSYPVLVPNMKGLEAALKTGHVSEIAVFGAASDAFSKKNVNCTVEESLIKLVEVATEALKHGIRVRGYVSCVVGCPYQGATDPLVTLAVTEKLLAAGCYEVSLGDTIGVGTPGSVCRLLDVVLSAVPAANLAVHFHDTYGQALSNILLAVEKGIRVADSSIAGLGGCPYANGATGNVATEDLVYMLHGMGFNTGVDLAQLVETSDWICQKMGRHNASRVATAMLNKAKKC